MSPHGVDLTDEELMEMFARDNRIAEEKRLKNLAWQKEYDKRNPHIKKRNRDIWAAKNPDADRRKRLRKYGIMEIEDYDELLLKQEGCCKICKRDNPNHKSGRFYVDHDHVTGKVRGLLCNRCNTKLAVLEDKAWCKLATFYLEENR